MHSQPVVLVTLQSEMNALNKVKKDLCFMSVILDTIARAIFYLTLN
jgi:hypothetical protein